MPVIPKTNVLRMALMGGTLTLMQTEHGLNSVRSFGGWNGLVGGGLHDARCWVLRDRNASLRRSDDSSGPLSVFASACWQLHGEGTARTLRTTQWTRAS